MRRLVFIAALLLAVGVASYCWLRVERPSQRKNDDAALVPPRPGSAKAQASSAASDSSTARESGSEVGRSGATVPSLAADFPIAAPLNAPGSSIARDLDIVQQLFHAWQTNFPHEGNPVGENAEITAALMGDNRLGLALIPKDHRAVNDRGELCDRWGTPFRFHQISGTQMEIRSAGPDRKFATEDDALWAPP